MRNLRSLVAIAMGEGGKTQAPLARAVFGGLLVSTGISLIVIPVIYTLVEKRLERRRQRKAAVRDQQAPT